MMYRRARAFWLLLMILTVLVAAPAWAVPVQFVSSAVDSTAQTAQFMLQFSAPIDLLSVDAYGRNQDAFHLFIYDDPRAQVLSPYDGRQVELYRQAADGVITGEDIRFGNGLPVRDNVENAFGWGSVTQLVPFTLDHGTNLLFTADLAALGDRGDGRFSYAIETFHFGLNDPIMVSCQSGMSGAIDRVCSTVPEPSTLWLTLLGFVWLAGFAAWRSRQRKTGTA
jgi:hypothetical protein